MDGLITAQGDKATGYAQGAGSGGSFLFEVTNMTGMINPMLFHGI